MVGAALPGSDETSAVRSVTRLCPDAAETSPPVWLADVVARIQRLLSGEAEQLADVPMLFDQANSFEREVYGATLAIPHGETRTYG